MPVCSLAGEFCHFVGIKGYLVHNWLADYSARWVTFNLLCCGRMLFLTTL